MNRPPLGKGITVVRTVDYGAVIERYVGIVVSPEDKSGMFTVRVLSVFEPDKDFNVSLPAYPGSTTVGEDGRRWWWEPIECCTGGCP